jgi:hypothetical protein
MAQAAATTKKRIDENLMEGFNEDEKKFLLALGEFLTKYPNFAGDTPFDRSLAAKFEVGVTALGALRSTATCKRWCWDPVHHMYYCCGF